MLKSRLLFLFIVFAAAWGLVVLRSAQLQILPDSKLAELQKRQFRAVVELPPRRGAILDRAGKELAVSVPAYSVFADPEIIEKPKLVARTLGPLISEHPNLLLKKIKVKNKRFVWLKRRISTEDKARIQTQIQNKNLKGIGFVEESRRVYPNGDFLSQVLGFVGSEDRGLEGLERHFDSYLRGEKKILRFERDARGRPLVLDGQVFTEMPSGADLELTIDSEIQFTLEKALKETRDSLAADSALGVVIDVGSNEVLAMAQTPGFDPNRPFASPVADWRNRTISDVFEPGSVVKSLVIAGAIDNELFKPNSRINCEGGKLQLGDRVVREADPRKVFDMLSVSEVLAKSSNIGTTKIALKMGDQLLQKTITSFGLGARTALETSGEAKGLLKPLPWRPHLMANISFGHGVATTPLQIANAYTAIANGGTLRQPILVRAIRNPETGEEIQIKTKDLGQPISAETARLMRLMLTEATGEHGTGYLARVAGFPVAGKTGTAQKVDASGGYRKGEYISSFAGMIPSHQPKYVIYVAVDNPRDKYYGSEVAAPLFSRIAAYAIRKSGLSPILISENNVLKSQVPAKVDQVAIDRIREFARSIETGGEDQVPDLTGLSLREALNRVRGSNLKLKPTGRGLVLSTDPSAGEPLPTSRTLQVKLQ